jgi:hypothetical protein
MNELFRRVQSSFHRDLTKASLKTLIIMWAVLVILLALYLDDTWALAALLSWEVLP